MKIIDYNPDGKVPPIFRTTKLVISYQRVAIYHFISFAKKENGLYTFHGSNKIFGKNTKVIKWTDAYNRGSESLLELLISEWNWLPRNWSLQHIIIESEKELEEFITEYDLPTMLAESMRTQWKLGGVK